MAAIDRFIATTRDRLARHLTALREAANLTQEELALRLDYSRSTIGNAEGGHKNASPVVWERVDLALGAGGALVATHKQLQDAIRRRAELLDRADQPDPAPVNAEPLDTGKDPLTGAGVRVSAAVLDLLAAVRETVQPDRAGLALDLSVSTLDALRQVQIDTGHSASTVTNYGIRLYSYIRTLLAGGAEILIRQPGTEDHIIRLK